MKCKYFEDECELTVINDKNCRTCLLVKQSVVLNRLDQRLTKLEQSEKASSKKTRVTGKTPKVEIEG